MAACLLGAITGGGALAQSMLMTLLSSAAAALMESRVRCFLLFGNDVSLLLGVVVSHGASCRN